MTRITKGNLDFQFKLAAQAKGWDIEQPIWTRQGNNNIARIGAVFLEHNTYSGSKVCQMTSLGGGERVIFHGATARELYSFLKGAAQ